MLNIRDFNYTDEKEQKLHYKESKLYTSNNMRQR